MEWPGHEAFSYTHDQILQPLGNSAPILVVATQRCEYPTNLFYGSAPQAYIGRYGEVRGCDKWNMHTLASINGEKVFDSNDGGNWEVWNIENANNNHEKGLFEVTFTNENIRIDDEIEGFNITTVNYDERNEDIFAPTLQMLIFKDTNGIITDRFQSSADGIIEFSAGDFNWHWIMEIYNGYFTCSPADVKVEYAPYGEDTFAELTVEEIPELYYMPGFGNFYRGSLKDVNQTSVNGWFDLRFTLADEAGNRMVQHLSPAFKVDNLTGVPMAAVAGKKVWSDRGTIRVNSDEVAMMEAYSMDGRLLGRSYGNALAVAAGCNVCLVKVTAADGTVTTHKLFVR